MEHPLSEYDIDYTEPGDRDTPKLAELLADDKLGKHMSGKDVTYVVFRKWKRSSGNEGVIALFPYERSNLTMCMSYEHIGQHGGADYTGVVSRTVLATEDEYAPLKRELESEPFNYVLKVQKRR